MRVGVCVREQGTRACGQRTQCDVELRGHQAKRLPHKPARGPGHDQEVGRSVATATARAPKAEGEKPLGVHLHVVQQGRQSYTIPLEGTVNAALPPLFL